MENFMLAIPSKGAVGKLRSKTVDKLFPLLKLPESTFMFVYPEEKTAYEKEYPGLKLWEVTGGRGISYKRKFIINTAKEKKMKYVIMIDDDLNLIQSCNEKKFPISKILFEMVRIAQRDNLGILSPLNKMMLYFKYHTNDFSKVDIETNKVTYAHIFWLIDVEKALSIDNFDDETSTGDDIDFSIRMRMGGYKVKEYTRALYYSIPPKNRKGGGLFLMYRDKKIMEKGVKYLQEKYKNCKFVKFFATNQDCEKIGYLKARVLWKEMEDFYQK